ncbi:FCD domain-containing protein [Salinibacterium sp. TMP30]|uniref:FadR/GntR family transcriptional regulator n=1 Tax=Salinibacterium sp. TMP30 TaxID=3138237 RepID=UPI0031396F24
MIPFIESQQVGEHGTIHRKLDSNSSVLRSFRGLHGQVIEGVGEAIGAGRIPIGAQLVPESIAIESKTSRALVREALRVLQSKGLVIARPRTGTRVRPVSEWDLLDPDVIRWRAGGIESAKQLRELLDLRGAIEPLAARHAARATTPAHLHKLQTAVDAMAVAVARSDWNAFTDADVEFHRGLLEAGGNQIVGQLAGPIESALRVRHALNLIPHELTAGVVASHQSIVDAIVDQDVLRSELASRRIVDVAGAEVISALLSRD